jgi:hypothetical protein
MLKVENGKNMALPSPSPCACAPVSNDHHGKWESFKNFPLCSNTRRFRDRADGLLLLFCPTPILNASNISHLLAMNWHTSEALLCSHVMPLSWSMPLLYLLPTNTLLKPAMASYIASYTGQHTHCACGTLLDIYGNHFFSCQWYHPKTAIHTASRMDICTCSVLMPSLTRFAQPHIHMYMICPHVISTPSPVTWRIQMRTFKRYFSCSILLTTLHLREMKQKDDRVLFMVQKY